MSESTPAPDGATTPPADGASQQTPPDAPDGSGTPAATDYKDEANKAFAARDTAKANAKSLAAQNEALTKQIAELQASTPNVSQQDLDRLEKIKADEAEAERNKAMKAGDADAIAQAARKPLEETNKALGQANTNLKDQLATLLRDKALKAAVGSSQLGAVAPDVIVDALKHRVVMTEVGGQYVPEFLNGDSQPLYNDKGKVTDVQVFVDGYLRANPALCKAKAQPGSGATPPGTGSATPATEGQKPKSIQEWTSWTPEQQEAANMQPGELSALTFPTKAGTGMFG